jgi:hypothetical protein
MTYGHLMNVEHVTSLIAAAAGLRELHGVDLRHNPAYLSTECF